jgi:hypothetical protein
VQLGSAGDAYFIVPRSARTRDRSSTAPDERSLDMGAASSLLSDAKQASKSLPSHHISASEPALRLPSKAPARHTDPRFAASSIGEALFEDQATLEGTGHRQVDTEESLDFHLRPLGYAASDTEATIAVRKRRRHSLQSGKARADGDSGAAGEIRHRRRHKRRRKHHHRGRRRSHDIDWTAEASGRPPATKVVDADEWGSDSGIHLRPPPCSNWRLRACNMALDPSNPRLCCALTDASEEEPSEDEARLKRKLQHRRLSMRRRKSRRRISREGSIPAITLNAEVPATKSDAAEMQAAILRARSGSSPPPDYFDPGVLSTRKRERNPFREFTKDVATLSVDSAVPTESESRRTQKNAQRSPEHKRHRVDAPRGVLRAFISLFRSGSYPYEDASEHFDSDLENDSPSPEPDQVEISVEPASPVKTATVAPISPQFVGSPGKGREVLRSPGRVAVGIGPIELPAVESLPELSLPVTAEHAASVATDQPATAFRSWQPRTDLTGVELTTEQRIRDAVQLSASRLKGVEGAVKPPTFWMPPEACLHELDDYVSDSERPRARCSQGRARARSSADAKQLVEPKPLALGSSLRVPRPTDLLLLETLQALVAPRLSSRLAPARDAVRKRNAGFITAGSRCNPHFVRMACPLGKVHRRARASSFDVSALRPSQLTAAHTAHAIFQSTMITLLAPPSTGEHSLRPSPLASPALGPTPLASTSTATQSTWLGRLFSRSGKSSMTAMPEQPKVASSSSVNGSTSSVKTATRIADTSADEADSVARSGASVISDDNSEVGGYETDSSYESSFVKSLQPSSEQLKLLHLRSGANDISFVAQNGEAVSATLYLWTSESKIVISDIDGTITKSDVRGHLYNLVGWDWTHAGVAQLYSNIAANGYHIIYLTSRAIGQVDATKDYLSKVAQTGFSESDFHMEGGKGPLPSNAATITKAHNKNATDSPSGALAAPGSAAIATGTAGAAKTVQLPNGHMGAVFKLPPGPVITSPDRLWKAFTREVLLRKPDEFKIAALSDIARLFPHGSRPFYAGFGNRHTDVKSYRAVHIHDSKIFIVNPEGDIRQFSLTYRKSYPSINALVHEMFPPMTEVSITQPEVGNRYGRPVVLDEAFGDAQYWKTSHPPVPSTVLSDVNPEHSVLPMPSKTPAKAQGKESSKVVKADSKLPSAMPAQPRSQLGVPSSAGPVLPPSTAPAVPEIHTVEQVAIPVPEAVRVPYTGGLSMFGL